MVRSDGIALIKQNLRIAERPPVTGGHCVEAIFVPRRRSQVCFVSPVVCAALDC